jgi:predicted O-linked N-acetylglucosamine transferase (SPINDLY family)
LIGDPTRTPDGEDTLFSETVLRLPRSAVCFTPPEAAPGPGAPPSAATGVVTFGSLNDPSKLTREVIALWARVLGENPGARLILKYPGLEDGGTADHLIGRFTAAGVESGRIELRGASPSSEVLAAYADIDIALDPFPYSGDMTTLECLWMGVPVVTLPGDRPIARMTAGHLKAIGLDNLIAATQDDYVGIARGLAENPTRLAGLRAGLRDQISGSPLCDGVAFARDFEAALRDAWRRWCAQ